MPVAIFLCAIGLVQGVFLPGLVATMRLRGWNCCQRIIFAIPLSLVINHFLVWFFCALGIYGPASMGFVVVAEIIALFLWRTRAAPFRYPALDRLADGLFLLLAMAQVTKYFEAWGRFFGDIFSLGDAVGNWNFWGKLWWQNKVPVIGMYPPAIPQLYSLPYALAGRADIETFAKASVGLLFLGALLALLELGFRRKDFRATAWACICVFSAVQARFLQSHWASGYVDVPLATMTIFSFALASLDLPGALVIYGITAGGAGIVKQPGILFAAVSPWLARGFTSWRDLFRRAAFAILAGAPWTLFGVVWIYVAKQGGNNVDYLSHMVKGGVLDHWAFTMRLVIGYGESGFLFGLVAASLLGAAVSRDARRWLFCLGLPWFFIWGTFFGYDIRNIAMSLFPFSLAAAAGIAWLAARAEARLGGAAGRWLSRPSAERIFRICVALSLVSTLVGFKKPIQHWRQSGSLLAWEAEQRRYLGDFPRGNDAVYAILPCLEKEHAVLVTNYQPFTSIPDLARHITIETCGEIMAGKRTHRHAYAFIDITAECDPGVGEELQKGAPLYGDGRAFLVALDPSLPTSCAPSGAPEAGRAKAN